MANNKPPFDPVWGAWIALLLMLGVVILGQLLIALGCILGVTKLCDRDTGNLTSIALEVLTAIAILISARKS